MGAFCIFLFTMKKGPWALRLIMNFGSVKIYEYFIAGFAQVSHIPLPGEELYL